MKRYAQSILILFVCMLIMTPSTVYAEDLVSIPVFSVIQPITGASLSSDSIPESLTERLCIYLTEGFTAGSIDLERYNQILYSGMVSENAFFADSVFVGDSLTVGFEQYCRTHDSIASGSTYFLARVSGSAKAAISKNALTKHAGIMPLLNGKAQYIEDSISQLPNVSKMFICYGMNDLTGSTPEQFVEDLQILITRIQEKNPGLKVYVISIPCVAPGVHAGWLSNDSIRATNLLLQEKCTVNGWGFVNITEYLMGADGAIRPEYSSDHYVHETSRAYQVWNKVLKDYAFMEITTQP